MSTSEQDAREGLRRGFYEEFAALCAKYEARARELGFVEMAVWFHDHAQSYSAAVKRMLSALRARGGRAA